MHWPEPSRDGGVGHRRGGLGTSRSRVHRTLQAMPLRLLGPLAAPVPAGTQPVALFPLDFCVFPAQVLVLPQDVQSLVKNVGFDYEKFFIF